MCRYGVGGEVNESNLVLADSRFARARLPVGRGGESEAHGALPGNGSRDRVRDGEFEADETGCPAERVDEALAFASGGLAPFRAGHLVFDEERRCVRTEASDMGDLPRDAAAVRSKARTRRRLGHGAAGGAKAGDLGTDPVGRERERCEATARVTAHAGVAGLEAASQRHARRGAARCGLACRELEGLGIARGERARCERSA